ncbi:MAG: TRAP transporter substrate-binding protein [Peptococcaceae bacterium]|nr:TRAP transporter substrate-binding protein [Peptococcaceae bacterium]
MSKKGITYLMSLTISLVIVLALSAGCAKTKPTDSQPATSGKASQEQVIKLTAANYLPPSHILSVMMGDMLKEIQTLSNGRLEITYAAGGSLLTAPKMADGLEQGLADIGFSHIGYTPGRFPVSEALDLPMGYPSSWVGTHVATDFLAKYKPKEWDKFHLLLVNGGTTAAINMAKSPVRKLEDLKGKTMRGAGEVADALKALGATPRDMPMTEVYEGMSKGTIDGLLVGAETLKSFKLADVTKYTTYVPSVGNQYLFYIAMNKSKWDSLPPDLQKIFNDVSAKYLEETARTWNKINVEGFQTAMAQGAEFITLSDEEAARWKKAVQPVIDNYVTKMVGKGFPEQQVKEQIAYIKERIAYWEQQQAAQHIPSEVDIKK